MCNTETMTNRVKINSCDRALLRYIRSTANVENGVAVVIQKHLKWVPEQICVKK